MTVVVAVLAVVVALLALLVVGLLRSHADILRRLTALDGGDDVPRAERDAAGPRTPTGVPRPPNLPTGRPAADLVGADLDEGALAVRVTGVAHDTLLLFLSSGCLTCRPFWDAAARPGRIDLPDGTRVVVVARDLDEESPSALGELAGSRTVLLLSSRAWADYGIPGSPYAVLVDGASGRIRGEGTGASWEQVARLLAQATGDLAFVGERAPRADKSARDAARERDTDAELLAAGILPGDPSLYPAPGAAVAQPPSVEGS